MANLLKTASDFLGDKLKDHASDTITYQRGSNNAPVLATFGRTQYGQDAEFEVAREDFESRDFMFHAADLLFNSVVVVPKAGDEIIWADGGLTYTFVVMPPPSEPAWRWADQFHKRRRVHTKLVKIA